MPAKSKYSSQEIYDLYHIEGKSYNEICDLLGCNKSQIVYHLNKFKKSSENMNLNDWILVECLTRDGVKLNNSINDDNWWVKRNIVDRKKQILDATNWLITDNFSQRIFHIMKGVTEVPVCKTCSGKVDFRQFHSGYREYCSIQCVTKSSERNAKISNHPNRKEAISKSQKVLKEKYGEDCFKIGEVIQEKMKSAKIEKYGRYNPSMDKIKSTCLERYGVEYYYQSDDFKKKRKVWLENQEVSTVSNVGATSNAEKEVHEFFEQIGYKFYKNRSVMKNGKELDGFNFETKTAFEYCGLFWHSEINQNDKNYHYNKLKICESQDISLFTIFEDEWLTRNSQVKNFLKAKMGVFENRLYARNCSVEFNLKPYQFFQDNHIQGRPNTIIFDVNLVNEGEIISSMSFGFHHRNGKDLVLNRYATRAGTQVVSGSQRLFSHARKVLDGDIVTWSDNRWTNGALYNKIGFEFDREYLPDYSYYKNNCKERIPKQSMRKSVTGCPKDKTEHEWALENKFYRIYDCGKKRWVSRK